ncbi:MBL fold metallo-hydrolase [Corynebacterium pseudotuberculosis]|uniref:MBL fold metallo-hydrolase n=1 Tax=Corynebacterium pseudotuberculosis (strain C231) TaxID=681645 RepID=D9QDX8_CORP2|nr:MBL fold metallo-hydrolase [Corynebacterium pseudotuberculosis]ADK27997.2 MBL fold metallo-hydrolase [Corynebacterium pseudotuberculosis FRC41]ADL09701.1 MBL fold metallo-hydrolase [Corynebacterium pseudotuberculosis C231]ADL20107.1 MBL fold metallo-hydrolase [Corynebacterium pseudotuberculosis 1002]ADO25496.1 MBL fold metallo-hydrolase [Corynebacterium pseudotuberculosis I19]AEK91545.1 Metallo-beta-lactamase superfamily protein [Corynebacterium pseudotuberculosis PAT10]
MAKLMGMEHPAYSQLRPVSPSVSVVLCPNPGYAALEGTNSWVVRAEGDARSIVIDPGPEDEGHLNVLNSKANEVGLILLTHRHHDHADGAPRFYQLTGGAPIRAQDPAYCKGGAPLVDGEVITVDGVTPQVEVVFTPGHTADSVCFFVWSGEPHASELEGIITGDTIAGRHTTMISETDGDLGDYLSTLALLEDRGKDVRLMPGHGPDGDDVASFAHWYTQRRRQRLDQIRAARAELGEDVPIKQLIDAVYDDVDPVLRGAAEQSTRVALRYLAEQE